MSRKDKHKSSDEETVGDLRETETQPVLGNEPKAVPAKVAPGTPTFTFDRWFAQTGRPAHHKAGMQAHLQKKGRVRRKRTVAEWNALFAGY